jgi:cell division protein FtsL
MDHFRSSFQENIANASQQAQRHYFQAPWRKQLQMIGLLSLILVSVALVAGIYLNVSARATAVGREIQETQAKVETCDREIEDLTSHLAAVLSSREMEARAYQLGFKPVQPDELVYMKVPGIPGRQSPILVPYTERTLVSAPVLPPEYTESLFTWLKRQMQKGYLSFAEVLP